MRGIRAVINRHRDDAVGHHEDQECVEVDRRPGRPAGVGGPVGDVEDHQLRDLADRDVGEHPTADPHQLGDVQLPEVPPPPPAEPDPAQSGQQPGGLHHDAERRAEAEQRDLGPRQAGGVVLVDRGGEQERPAHRDDDEVVEDRREGRHREVAAGVEHRREQRGHAVEEDHREQQVGQCRDQIP
jgi:hypothetical protein